MTSSFNTVVGTQRDAPVDISKWNYAKTDADLTESVNKEIDNVSKRMNDHFSLLIKQENQRIQNEQAAHKELLDLIPKATNLIISERDRRIGNLAVKDHIDHQGLKDKHTTKWLGENPNHPDSLAIAKYEETEKANDNKFTDDEKEIQSQNAQFSTAADQVTESGELEGAQLLQGISSGDINERLDLQRAYDISSQWIEVAKQSLLVKMPDGSFKTLNQVSNIDEYRIANSAILSTFVADVVSKRNFSPRLLHQLLVKPLFKDYEVSKKKWITSNIEARKLTAKKDRGQALISQINQTFKTIKPADTDNLSDAEIEENSKIMGSVITDHIENYYGLHKYSWAQSREELFTFLQDAYDADKLTDTQVEAIGNSIIKGHDGGNHKLKNYWSKDYQVLNDKLKAKRRERIQEKKDEEKAELDKSDAQYKEQTESKEWSSKSFDEQEVIVKKWIKDSFTAHGIPSSYLNNLLSQIEVLDSNEEETYFNILLQRHEQGLKIDPSELRKFDRYGEWYPRAEELVNSKAMTQEYYTNAQEYVKSQTNAWTKENVGKDDQGSPRWVAVKQQADAAFRRYYVDFINKPGTTKEGAYDYAMNKVKENMRKGLYDQYPTVNPDQELSLNIAKTQRLVGQNPTLIDSAEPWEGEEVHLRAALSYLGYGKIYKGMVDPTVYYAPLLKGFPKDWSASTIMKKRLVATGLLKDDEKEVNPEQLINLDERILLNHKSTPSRTYRSFFENPDGKESLLKYTDFNNLDELNNKLRSKMSIRSAYTTPSLDWIQQVNIEPELIEQYNDILPLDSPFKNNFFMHLDTMLPGVAEEAVKTTLVEPNADISNE